MQRARVLTLAVLSAALVAGCATSKPPAAAGGCPEDSSAMGLNVSSGFGVTIGESGLRAAFNSIRDFFRQRPAAGSEADKERAAELAAEAAARTSAQPMTEEQRRALRSDADRWVQTYTEKCGPAAR